MMACLIKSKRLGISHCTHQGAIVTKIVVEDCDVVLVWPRCVDVAKGNDDEKTDGAEHAGPEHDRKQVQICTDHVKCVRVIRLH